MMGAGFGMASGALAGTGLLIAVRDLGFPTFLDNPYFWTILLSFVMSLIGVIAIMFLPSTHRHQLPEWENALPAEMRDDTGPAPAAPAAAPAPAGSGDGNGN
jgi:hypothetical protein